MNPFEAHEENVKRLYPQLIEIVEDESPADAGAALVAALTILAWREGICLESLLFMTRDEIKQNWLELRNLKPNGEVKEEEENGET
jgi:hypothetical protein